MSKFDSVRKEIANGLRQFALILNGEGICLDTSPLDKASASCLTGSGDRWGYTMSGLTLRVGTDVKCKPKVPDFDCRLDVNVEGFCLQSVDKDPLRRHDVQIVLKALRKNGPPVLQAWHFDRHIGPCSLPKPAHPRYHFSFGGRELDAHLQGACRKPHFDGLLLIDSPRLAHPPFDGILAIDFVLSSFAGTKWRLLRNRLDYQRIVSASQRRLWLPYVSVLYAHLDATTASPWSAFEVWPHMY